MQHPELSNGHYYSEVHPELYIELTRRTQASNTPPCGGGDVAAAPGASESESDRTGPYVRIINRHSPDSSQHTKR